MRHYIPIQCFLSLLRMTMCYKEKLLLGTQIVFWTFGVFVVVVDDGLIISLLYLHTQHSLFSPISSRSSFKTTCLRTASSAACYVYSTCILVSLTRLGRWHWLHLLALIFNKSGSHHACDESIFSFYKQIAHCRNFNWHLLPLLEWMGRIEDNVSKDLPKEDIIEINSCLACMCVYCGWVLTYKTCSWNSQRN